MYRSRKSLLSLALVVGFCARRRWQRCTPRGSGRRAASASGRFANTDRAPRRRRRVRGVKVHAIHLRAARRLRGAVKRIRATDERHQARRAPHEFGMRAARRDRSVCDPEAGRPTTVRP